MKSFIFFSGLFAVALAAPAPSPSSDMQTRNEAFDFQEWIDEIAANPEAEHMSAADAYEAAKKGIRSAEPPSDPNRIFKRDVSCNEKEPASVADAVVCIDQLAARGNEPCHVVYGHAANLCTHGLAQVVGVTDTQGGTTSRCQDVARALGEIMDLCWNPDNTVQGSSYAWGNGNMAVHLSGRLI